MKQHPQAHTVSEQPSSPHHIHPASTTSSTQHDFRVTHSSSINLSERPAPAFSDSEDEEHDDDLLSQTIVLPPPQSALDSQSSGRGPSIRVLSSIKSPQAIAAEGSRPNTSSRRASNTSSCSGPDEVDDIGATRSYVAILPPETLTRILALLDPSHLVKASFVCRKWASIARDDATWRLAFCKAFGLGGGAGMMRRTDASSWKAEYRTRMDLVRRWRKSRSPAISSDMRVANIHSLALSSKHSFLLSASSLYGVASRSDPFRGKVARGFLDAAGLLNGGGIGNPNTEFSPDVSCLATGSEANKIVWGFKNGSIAITSLGRQGSNPHGLVRNIKFSPRGSHLGAVNAIAFDLSVRGQRKRSQARQVALGTAADCFVTGGADGIVRLWSPERALPIWISSTAPDPPSETGTDRSDEREPFRRAATAPLQRISKLDFDADRGIVAAGTTSGQVYVWLHVNVSSLLTLSGLAWSDAEGDEQQIMTAKEDAARQSFKEEVARVAKVVISSGEEQSQLKKNMEGQGEVEYICLAGTTTSHTNLIVHRKGETFLDYHFLRETPNGWNTSTTVLEMSGTLEGDQLGEEGYITCVRAELGAASGDHNVFSTQKTPATSPLLRPALDESAPSLRKPSSTSPLMRPLLLGAEAKSSRNLSSGPFAEKNFVCVGTSSGCLVGWGLPPFEDIEYRDLSKTNDSRLPLLARASPSFVLDCHHAPLTSLDLAPHLFVVGTVDGQVKAFDSLTGEPLRTWADRMATKHLARQLLDPTQAHQAGLSTDERERFTVKQILVDEEWLVAAIGPWVLAWRPESALSGHQRRHAQRLSSPSSAAASPAGRRTSGMPPFSKYARMKELKMELAESAVILAREEASRQASYDRLRFARGSQELGGLSEEEALEHALILSRQEAEEQAHRLERGEEQEQESVQLSDLARIRREERELQDALEQIALASAEESRVSISSRSTSPGSGLSRSPSEADELSFEDEEGGYDEEAEDVEAHSRYLSLSPNASPLLVPRSPGSSSSRAWDILRASHSRYGPGSASPFPRFTSTNRSRWGEHTKVQTVRVAREFWSPHDQPLGNGKPGNVGGTEGQEEDWPSLNSGSYSSSHRSLSPLAQEEAFRLDNVTDPAIDSSDNIGKGRAQFSGTSVSPNFPSVSLHGPDLSPLSADASSLPPPTSPTPQSATTLSKPQPAAIPAVPAVQGAWANGSPSFRNAPAPTTNPLALVGGFSGPAFRHASAIRMEEELDDDLRFAIELSLAEDRSRR